MKNFKIIDLSIPIDDTVSEPFRPKIKHHPHKEGAAVMKGIFNCSDSDLPNSLGWANDTLTLITHAGTHLDAPWHFYPTTENGKKRAITIDEVPLEWCIGDGVVLDFHQKKKGELITIKDVQNEEKRIGYEIKERDIVLIRTDADKYWETAEYPNQGCGMGKEATLYLLNKGVKVTGIDSWGWDRPFDSIKDEFKKTGDSSIIWEGHFAGIEKEYCHLEKLTNLDKLPSTGFTIICFPVNIKGASAGWTRVVALISE